MLSLLTLATTCGICVCASVKTSFRERTATSSPDALNGPTSALLTTRFANSSVAGLQSAVLSPGVPNSFSIVASLAEVMFLLKLSLGGMGTRTSARNPSSFSNHSWGTAIDLFFGAAAVPQGAQKTARGCLRLAPFFNKHGWYWGAGFSGRSVDSMHFELAEETIVASAKALPARTAAAAAPPAAAVQASTFAGLDLAHFPGAPVMAKYRSAGFEITAVYASGGSERGSAVCALPRVFAGAVAARLFGGVFGARASTGFFAARFAMVASR
jgi:hypothetical protein